MRIPRTTQEFDTAWFQETFAGSDLIPGERVSRVEIISLGEQEGVLSASCRLAVHLEGDAGPIHLIGKLSASADPLRKLCAGLQFYEREVRFYQSLASSLGPSAPNVLLAEIDSTGEYCVLLLEEIVGAKSPDQLVGASRQEAELVVDTLAHIHAQWWGRPELDDMAWLPKINAPLFQGVARQLHDLWPVLLERWTGRLSEDSLLLATQFRDQAPQLLDMWAQNPHKTLCHYDPRVENWLFGGAVHEGKPVLVDWQMVCHHVGVFDLVYFMGTSLSDNERREWEGDLIERYCERLAEGGVQDYSVEQCREDFRAAVLNRFLIGLVGATVDAGGDERKQAVNDIMVTRMFAQADDWDVRALLA